MIKYMRQKVPTHNPAITIQIMQAKPDDEISDRIERVFRNISTEYRKTKQAEAAESTSDTTNHLILAQKQLDSKQDNRRKGRKNRVRIFVLIS
jgi:hypothetical protein